MKHLSLTKNLKETRMRISSFIATTLFAGAAGAIAGTLFAPNKGTKTRKKMQGKERNTKIIYKINFEDLTNSASHLFDAWKSQRIV